MQIGNFLSRLGRGGPSTMLPQDGAEFGGAAPAGGAHPLLPMAGQEFPGAPGPMPAAAAPGGLRPMPGAGGPPGDEWRPKWNQRLAGILQGQSEEDLMASHAAKIMGAAQAQDRAKLVSGLGDRERLGYYSDPDSYGKSVNANQAPQEVAGGNTLMRPGFGISVAPKLTEDGGVYGTQTPGGYQMTGERPISAAEQLAATRAAAQQALAERKQAALEAYQQGQLGLGGARVNIARARANRPAAGPGGGLPSGYRPRAQ